MDLGLIILLLIICFIIYIVYAIKSGISNFITSPFNSLASSLGLGGITNKIPGL